jgi:F-box/leucine-rich repeat protein 2/20
MVHAKKSSKNMSQTCAHLINLDISSASSSTRVTDAGLASIVSGCREYYCFNPIFIFLCLACLEVIRMTGSTQITDSTLIALSKAIPGSGESLRILECSGCFQISSHGVRALLSSCYNLEVLDVGYCWRISDDAFLLDVMNAEQQCFIKALRLRQKLRKHPLRAEGDLKPEEFHAPYASMNNENFMSGQWFVCERLRWLSIMFCYNVSDAAVHRVYRACPDLERFDLSNCVAVSTQARHYLLQSGISVGE